MEIGWSFLSLSRRRNAFHLGTHCSTGVLIWPCSKGCWCRCQHSPSRLYVGILFAFNLVSSHCSTARYWRYSLLFAGCENLSSMVINCVPTAKRRGEMLMGYHAHLRPGGHLFLMLPLLCLTNSKHTTRTSFVATLEKAGFRIQAARDSPKVAFFCATAVEVPQGNVPVLGKRRDTQLTGATDAKRGHRGRNDFAVSL